MTYREKTILITGASSGIGRAIAVKLANHNNRIAITGRRTKLLNEVAAEVRRAGSECITFTGDATNKIHAEKTIKEIVRRFGGIDIAILNVGAGPASNTLTAAQETILQTMRTNYDSLIHFFVPLMRQMKTQTTPCLIAHMNSLATYFGIPMQGDYTAAKAAGRIFLETARMEVKHFGYRHIKIQTIHPGFVRTKPKGDGLPRPGEISADKAADHVLKGLRSEVAENRFPVGTSLATRIGRIAPLWLKMKILLAAAPKRY